MRTVETRSVLKSGVVTGKVPADSGTVFFCARFPAIARIGITAKNLPKSIATPVAELYQSVLGLRPANADPLLPAAEVNAYSICVSPCGPGFVILAVPKL